MYHTQSILELRQMADESEQAEHFLMRMFFSHCGTAGCHIGTWCLNHPEDRLKCRDKVMAFELDGKGLCDPRYSRPNYYLGVNSVFAARFGISNYISAFLFTFHRHHFCENELRRINKNPGRRYSSVDAQNLEHDEAVARLRKYCDYIESQRRKWDNYYWQQSLPKKTRRFAKMELEGCVK